MANITSNLKIPLIEGSMHVARDCINNALNAIDLNAVNKSHLDSKGHWALWKKNTAYKVGDVFRTSDSPSWGYWRVTKAGTSGAKEPQGAVVDTVAKDGSCEYILCNFSNSSNGITSIARSGDNLIFTLSNNKQLSVSIDNITNAVMATNDVNNYPITSYVKSVTLNNDTVTVTKGNNSKTTFKVGIISSITGNDDTLTITDINTNKTSIIINNVKNAFNDSKGQALTDYIKDAAINNNVLTLTRGDGQQVTLKVSGGKTVGVEPWSNTVTLYEANESLVTYNDSLYMCLVTHRPSKKFDDDFNLGYWKQVDTDITATSDSGYYQATKKDVTASASSPYTFNLPIGKTDLFCLPPIEVLRKEDGLANVTETKYNMVANDAYDFSYNTKYMAFGDDLKPVTKYDVKVSAPVEITDGTETGYISETEDIDLSEYKTVKYIDI